MAKTLKQYYGYTGDVVFDKKIGSYTTLAEQKKRKEEQQERNKTLQTNN